MFLIPVVISYYISFSLKNSCSFIQKQKTQIEIIEKIKKLNKIIAKAS